MFVIPRPCLGLSLLEAAMGTARRFHVVQRTTGLSVYKSNNISRTMLHFDEVVCPCIIVKGRGASRRPREQAFFAAYCACNG